MANALSAGMSSLPGMSPFTYTLPSTPTLFEHYMYIIESTNCVKKCLNADKQAYQSLLL